MLEESLQNLVIEARKQNISKDKLIERLIKAYELEEELEKINKKEIPEISKRIEKLFFKIYSEEQIQLYIEVIEILNQKGDGEDQICAICNSVDEKYGYKNGYTYGRTLSMTQYILSRILKFGHIKQREFKSLLKKIHGGGMPYIKGLLYYEFDIEKISKLI